MSRLPEPPDAGQFSDPGFPRDTTLCADHLIEDYLDHLCAPLVGIVPYSERSGLREDAADMIERLSSRYTAEGIEPERAAQLAIEKHGASHEVSRQFLEAWFSHQPHGVLARRFGLANAHAVVYFGLATFLATTIIQVRVFNPCLDLFLLGLTPAQMRQIVPEPLPLPDTSPLQAALVVIAVLAPFVAGYLTGSAVPVGAARAVYQAMMPLIVFTLVLGALVLPTREGLLLALFQLVFWLPVGCLVAHAAGPLAWRRRLTRNHPLRSL
ncbi:MAG: hypothetical protein H7Z41_00030 [Cytophagales bacterium]|nr:hypothetical protein [Armatimonadota bacterium]